MSANANADAGAVPGMEARAADLLSRWRAAFETGDPRAAETLYSEIAALAAAAARLVAGGARRGRLARGDGRLAGRLGGRGNPQSL